MDKARLHQDDKVGRRVFAQDEVAGGERIEQARMVGADPDGETGAVGEM